MKRDQDSPLGLFNIDSGEDNFICVENTLGNNSIRQMEFIAHTVYSSSLGPIRQ